MTVDSRLLDRLGIELPILQAPMAGVSTPALAAAVSNTGALGAIAVGGGDAAAARSAIMAVRAATARPFNVNVFVHRPPTADPAREAGWLAALAPAFRAFGVEPPHSLRPIYGSFNEDDAMFATLVELAPPVVSFHFGLPTPERAKALRDTGAILMATVTSLDEARAAEAAGMDMIVAQGWEAGGHRGVFDPSASDDRLGTTALTRLLVRSLPLPVVAAGGLMDGAALASVLGLGAAGAQLGTAFIACPESSASPAHRAALFQNPPPATEMTAAISGRPARGIQNRLTALLRDLAGRVPPDYPVAYDAARALSAAAMARGDEGFAAQWAGQGLGLARALPAGELVQVLAHELRIAQSEGPDAAGAGSIR